MTNGVNQREDNMLNALKRTWYHYHWGIAITLGLSLAGFFAYEGTGPSQLTVTLFAIALGIAGTCCFFTIFAAMFGYPDPEHADPQSKD